MKISVSDETCPFSLSEINANLKFLSDYLIMNFETYIRVVYSSLIH